MTYISLPAYAELGTDGKLLPSQLPDLSITEVFVVNSQAAMLALSAQTGDIAIRTDTNENYILSAEPASTLGNWILLLVPPDAVTSVFGRTGNVVAAANDYNVSQLNASGYTAGSILFSNGTTVTQDNTNFFWDDANNQLKLGNATATAPAISFGGTDNGFYGGAGVSIRVGIGGSHRWTISATEFASAANGGAYLTRATATSTVPSISFVNDTDTGLGFAGANILSLIAGGVNVANLNSSGYFGVGTTTPAAMIDCTMNNLGTTQSETAGILVINNTAAASGLQQISPPIIWKGQGWKTTATAASQTVAFMADVLPVQGTTSPTANWQLKTSINGAAYTNTITVFSSNSTIGFGTQTGSTTPIIGPSTNGTSFASNGAGLLFGSGVANGTGYNHSFIANFGDRAPTTGTSGSILVSTGFIPSSGTGVWNSLAITPIINQTGGANGITRGLYVAPTLTAAADFRAIETTIGEVMFSDSLTGSQATPTLDIATTWNTSGTPTAIRLNITDTSSNASSLLIDLQTSSTSRFKVDKSGVTTAASSFISGGSLEAFSTSTIRWQGRSRFQSPSNGVIRLSDAAESDFSRLQFGGGTTSYPAIKRSTTSLEIRLADDSAYTDLVANSISSRGYDSGAQRFRFNGGSTLNYGYMRSSVDGVFSFTNSAENDFGRLCFGGTTSSFPSIKRSSATLQVRLADDSAFADLSTARLIADNVVRLKGYTVATLPTGTQGDVAFVTDASGPTFLATVVGGGAVVTKVFYNGSNWIVG